MPFIYGTSGDDSLLGTSGSDVLMGYGGNDTLDGGDGVYGDYVDYYDAAAAVHVDLALGVTSGGDGNDLLIGIEHVFGSTYNDTLLGDDQANILSGNSGQDVLNGAGGNDQLYLDSDSGDTVTGGNGNDIFYLHFFDLDPIFLGNDVSLITDLALGEFFQPWVSNALVEISAGDGSDVLFHEMQVGIPVGGITRLYFGGNDAPGADYSIDLVGDFSVEDFVLSDFTSRVTYNPVLNQAQSLVVEYGYAEGGRGNDTIDASGSHFSGNRLYGNVGDDLLIGGSMEDYLTGGMGNDTLIGGDGVDRVTYGPALYEGIYADLSLGVVTGGAGNDSLVGIEGIEGTSKSDTLIGSDADNFLYGQFGSSDSLYGKGGNDYLWCGGGRNDVNGFMSGGAGNDTMTAAGDWLGVMSGDEGNDTFFVRNGNETVLEQAGQGFDTVISSSSSYTLPDGVERGIIATDLAADLSGNAQDNFLRAGAGNNVINGGAGVDRVAYADATAGVTVSLAISGSQATGASGNDMLISIENLAGSSYNDNLSGDAGDNVLLGGFGQDTLTGNGGNDRFDFNSLKASGNTIASADVISDFSPGDLINLKKIDANKATPGNAIFKTLLTAGEDFTQPAQLKFADGVLYGNTDADAEPEFAIVLTGVTSLSLSDLIL